MDSRGLPAGKDKYEFGQIDGQSVCIKNDKVIARGWPARIVYVTMTSEYEETPLMKALKRPKRTK